MCRLSTPTKYAFRFGKLRHICVIICVIVQVILQIMVVYITDGTELADRLVNSGVAKLTHAVK